MSRLANDMARGGRATEGGRGKEKGARKVGRVDREDEVRRKEKNGDEGKKQKVGREDDNEDR